MYDNHLVVDIVEELNQELYDKLGEKEYYKTSVSWTYNGNGTVNIIEFQGHPIWHSEDDGREFYEETNTYEDLKQHCYKQLGNYYALIGKILYKE